MGTELQRLEGDSSSRRSRMHRRARRGASPTPSDDSIQNDLVAMGIIPPKSKNPVAGEEPPLPPPPPAAAPAAAPKRSLKITLTGIRSDCLQNEKAKREKEKENRQENHKSAEEEEAEMITRSQATAAAESEGGICITPRNQKDASDVSETQKRSSTLIETTNTPASKRKRLSNGQWTSFKRQRGRPNKSADEDVVPANDAALTSSSDNNQNADTIAQTRSGRKVHRPEVLVIEDHRSLRVKRESENVHLSHFPPTNSQAQQLPRRDSFLNASRRQRLRNQRSIQSTSQSCVRCERSNVSTRNLLVHCDKCHQGWHQFCHDPPISEEYVENKHAQWTCCKCVPRSRKTHSESPRKRNLKRKGRPALGNTGTTTLSRSKDLTTELIPTSIQLPVREVGASHFSYDECRGYLASLSHTALVKLLLDISTTSPDLPIFPQNLRSLPSVSFLPDSTPSSVSKQAPIASDAGMHANNNNNNNTASHESNDDDDESVYAEEHRLYPKPGNGFKLPPIDEDMHMMVEDSSCATFSHALHGHAAADRLDAKVQRPSDMVNIAG